MKPRRRSRRRAREPCGRDGGVLGWVGKVEVTSGDCGDDGIGRSPRSSGGDCEFIIFGLGIHSLTYWIQERLAEASGFEGTVWFLVATLVSSDFTWDTLDSHPTQRSAKFQVKSLFCIFCVTVHLNLSKKGRSLKYLHRLLSLPELVT